MIFASSARVNVFSKWDRPSGKPDTIPASFNVLNCCSGVSWASAPNATEANMENAIAVDKATDKIFFITFFSPP
ncbi:hypothetical protein D3C81_1714270 [compost metagenome]